MIRMILAAAAAFALVSATPAFACPNCNQCAHKDQVAAADKAEKKDGEKKAVTCGCAGEGKECKCGPQCQCAHCGAKKAEKKDEKKS